MPSSSTEKGTLQWRQPAALERRYVLEDGAVELAVLTFRSAFGSLAVGESAASAWTFKRVGFFSTRITVRESGADADLAVFTPATWHGGGTLALADGRSLRLVTNTWRTRLEVLGDDDQPLVVLSIGGLLHLKATVEHRPSPSGGGEPLWLLMLACYLVVCMRDDAAAAVAVLS